MSFQSATQPADQDIREQALDTGRSFAVTAPAGSGKTSLLTQRVLKLLSQCERPEQVLAITFTRKAAQEMKQRILDALRRANSQSIKNDSAAEVDGATLSSNDALTLSLAREVLEQDARRQWHLQLSPNRLRVQTIDSFCQTLVQQLPLSAGAGALLNTTEVADVLYREAVRELLWEFNSDRDLAADLSRLLLHVDSNVDTLEKLLVELLQSRGQWLNTLYAAKYAAQDARRHLELSLQTIIEETLRAAQVSLEPILNPLLESAIYAKNNLEKSDSVDAQLQGLFTIENTIGVNTAHQDLPAWQALMALLTTNEGSWRKQITVKQGFPTSANKALKAELQQHKQKLLDVIAACSEQEGLLDLVHDIKTLPPADIDEQQWQLLDSLTRILPQLVAHFRIVCERHGQCDFGAITEAALTALGSEEEPSELTLKLDYQIQHILVDEFQDTSLPQLQLLQRLTAGWQNGDGRTLFLVGDAMQSCYGFRDANVGIFMDACRHGIGDINLTPLSLHVNFRSRPSIVEWVNRTFAQAFPQQDNVSRGAITYTPATAYSSAETHTEIKIYGFPEQDERAQAQQVVDIVSRHFHGNGQGQGNRQPQDKEQEREKDQESIAILARNRSHLREILIALRNAGIQWQARDVDPLAQRMAVVDLLSLTKALLDPGDRIAWLSVLRAPWCGLSLNDLHVVANQQVAENRRSLSAHGYPLLWRQLRHWRQLDLTDCGKAILERVVPILDAALQQRRRKSLRQWVQGTWLALGGPAAVNNPEELFSVHQFFDLLQQQSSPAGIDWQRFDQQLAQLYDQSTNNSRLQVMTIHKAKGLEFDTVIVPGLGRRPRGDDNDLLLWQDFLDNRGHNHVLLSPLQQIGGAEDPIYQYLKRERNIRQQLEATRLLYIACTRAISNLYLLTELKENKNGELEAPNKNSLLNCIWSSLHNQVEIITDDNSSDVKEIETSTESQAGTQTSLHHIFRLMPRWQAPHWQSDGTLASYRARAIYEEANEPEIETPEQRQARQIGILLHGILQQITETGCDNWNPDRIERQQPHWRVQLQQLGFDDSAQAWSSATIKECINACLNHPVGRWLLDNSHPDSACELAVLVPNSVAAVGGRAAKSHYIIDRTFVEDGVRWIVDYKSSQPAAGESLDHFLERELEEYRPQLETYAELMRQIDSANNVKTALFFPLLQVFREL